MKNRVRAVAASSLARVAASSFARVAASRSGKAGWAILWLLGVPVPILVILFLVRGCT